MNINVYKIIFILSLVLILIEFVLYFNNLITIENNLMLFVIFITPYILSLFSLFFLMKNYYIKDIQNPFLKWFFIITSAIAISGSSVLLLIIVIVLFAPSYLNGFLPYTLYTLVGFSIFSVPITIKFIR